MLRTIRRAATVAAGTTVLAVAVATGAGAADTWGGLSQMESATRINLDDIRRASIQASAPAANDVTCLNPVTVGAPATVPVRFLVGELYGTDVAQADAHCMSYQGTSYGATLTVTVEYQPYYGAAYQPIPGCTASTYAPASLGVLVMTSPAVTCVYKVDSPYAGRPHRAHSTLVTTVNPYTTYHGYSAAPWLDTTVATSGV